MKNRIIFGIRTRFFMSFFVSLLIGFIVFFTINGMIRNGVTDYSIEISRLSSQCDSMIKDIKLNNSNDKKLQEIINKNIFDFYIYITDRNGKVLIQNENQIVVQIDIEKLIKSQTEIVENSKSKEHTGGKLLYNKHEDIGNDRYVVINAILIRHDEIKAVFAGITIFIFMFFLLTYKKIKYIKILSDSLKTIAKGNLNYNVEVKGKDELTMLASNINHMTSELREKKVKEEQMERTKNELIANVSHDLRTPLTSIMGYTKLLKEKNKEYELESYIDIIDEKSQKLETLIKDLFEYTILTDCHAKLETETVSLNELIRQVTEGMLPLAEQNNVSIDYYTSDSELNCYVDASKMARVFENIITNAIKYSDKPGKVVVNLKQDGNTAIVSIYNKGRKIDTKDIPRIFDRLYRTDEARNSETGGSGIGLCIAKSIVALHDGSIWVENDENGVCFYVSIKIQN